MLPRPGLTLLWRGDVFQGLAARASPMAVMGKSRIFTNIIQKCLAERLKTTTFASSEMIMTMSMMNMKRVMAVALILVLWMGVAPVCAQNTDSVQTAVTDSAAPAVADSSLASAADNLQEVASTDETPSFHQLLKTKFIEGNAGFMSLVALALVLGLAFCIERIIFLALSETDAKKFMTQLTEQVEAGQIDSARLLCEATPGPVAAVCRQGLLRYHEDMANIERTLVAYGSVQAANLEKGCSWISLFIAMAPSLGFLGTVIGMVMAFDQIQAAGDISPTIVASGMRVALITTIFGIIVALVLQVFYNYILSKIDRLTTQMEEAVIGLLDAIAKSKGATA